MVMSEKMPAVCMVLSGLTFDLVAIMVVVFSPLLDWGPPFLLLLPLRRLLLLDAGGTEWGGAWKKTSRKEAGRSTASCAGNYGRKLQ